MTGEKSNILGKCFRRLISAIGATLGIAANSALLPTIAICQGLTVPMPITSQNHSNRELAIQLNLINQGVIISWSDFSPNGKFYAYAENVDINVWEVESGNLLKTFKGKPGAKYSGSWSVEFSPDSKLLACGSDGNTLRVWDIESGKELKSFRGKAEQVSSIAFSPDGKLLATGGIDKFIRLWDVGNGREIKSFAGHDRAVKLIVFSPDGKQLASASGNKTIKLWDIKSGKPLKSFDVNYYVDSLDFLLKNKVLVSSNGNNRLNFMDIETGQEIKALNDIASDNRPMIFSPDHKLAAGIKLYGKTIMLWNMESGKELQSFEPDTSSRFDSIIFSPDSKVLAIKSDKTIRFWDVKSKKLLKSINSQPAYLRKFLPDGKVLGFSWGKNRTIYRWDFKSGGEFKSILK